MMVFEKSLTTKHKKRVFCFFVLLNIINFFKLHLDRLETKIKTTEKGTLVMY